MENPFIVPSLTVDNPVVPDVKLDIPNLPNPTIGQIEQPSHTTTKAVNPFEDINSALTPKSQNDAAVDSGYYYGEDQKTRFNKTTYNPLFDSEQAYFDRQGVTGRIDEVVTRGLKTAYQMTTGSLLSEWDSIYHADASKLLNSKYILEAARSLEKLDETNPIYHSKEYLADPHSWASKMSIEGGIGSGFESLLGFTGGMALTAGIHSVVGTLVGAAAGSVIGPEGTIGGAISGFVSGIGNSVKILQKIRTLSQAAVAGEELSVAARSMSYIPKIKTFGQKAASSILAAHGEAAIEAINAKDEFIKEQLQSGIDRGTYGMQDILDSAKKVQLTTYGLNLITLMGSNYIQDLPLLKQATKSLLGTAESQIIFNGLKAEGLTRIGLAKSIGKTMVTDALTEGTEEGIQYAVSAFSKDYYGKKLNSLPDTVKLYDSMAKSIQDSFGPDGFENIFGGLASGFFMGLLGGTYKHWGAINKSNKLAQSINEHSAHVFQKAAEVHEVMNTLNNISPQDTFNLKSKMNEMMFKYTDHLRASGSVDAAIDNLNLVKNMDMEEVNKSMNTNFSDTPTGRMDLHNYIDNLISGIKTQDKIIEETEKQFEHNPYTPSIVDSVKRIFNQKHTDPKTALNNAFKQVGSVVAELKSDYKNIIQREASMQDEIKATFQTNLSSGLTATSLGELMLSNPAKIEAAIKSTIKSREDAGVSFPDDQELKSLLSKIEGKSGNELINEIIDFVDTDPLDVNFKKRTLSKINDLTKVKIAKDFISSQLGKTKNQKGLDELLQKVVAGQIEFYSEVEKNIPTAIKEQVTAQQQQIQDDCGVPDMGQGVVEVVTEIL